MQGDIDPSGLCCCTSESDESIQANAITCNEIESGAGESSAISPSRIEIKRNPVWESHDLKDYKEYCCYHCR